MLAQHWKQDHYLGFKVNVCTSATPLMKSVLFPKAPSVWSGSGLMATPQWRATLVITTNKHVTQSTPPISVSHRHPCACRGWSTACCIVQLIYSLLINAPLVALVPMLYKHRRRAAPLGCANVCGSPGLGVAYCRTVPTPTLTVACCWLQGHWLLMPLVMRSTRREIPPCPRYCESVQ